jgi:hypothetical protein
METDFHCTKKKKGNDYKDPPGRRAPEIHQQQA